MVCIHTEKRGRENRAGTKMAAGKIKNTDTERPSVVCGLGYDGNVSKLDFAVDFGQNMAYFLETLRLKNSGELARMFLCPAFSRVNRFIIRKGREITVFRL